MENNVTSLNITKRTGILTNALIWFGVAISVSEIEAGIQIATASTLSSLWIPLVLGHLLGGVLLFLVGLIGARVRKNAMETTVSAFGKYGSKFFASLNVMQLIAWVAVLNAQGTLAIVSLNLPLSFPVISAILAALVAIWVYIGLFRSSKLTNGVISILLVLLTILSVKMLLFNMTGTNTALGSSPALTFWNIFEISIAMPISWLPVISDYTRDVEKPVKTTAISATAYTVASLWMYFLGVGIVYFIGTSSIAESILLMGLGIPGVIILVLSTVTSNLVATNSAGESAKSIFSILEPKTVGIVVSVLSVIIAVSGIMDHYIGFLYLISSVFAPMAAVLLVSFYLDDNDDEDSIPWKWNLFAWFAGFIVYQIAGFYDSIILGPTLLCIIASAVLAYVPILVKR